MSDAHERIHPFEKLTRTQKKVLADLELFSGGGERVSISSRKLAESTGLSRPTVLNAVEALNDLHLISTEKRERGKASLHTLLFRGSVRLSPGQISPSAMSASTGGAR
jgi:DNA-binding transcriptional MocR family regulator